MTRHTLLLPVLIAFLAGASPAHAWTWPADGPVLQPFRFGDDPYAAGLHRGIDVGGPPGTGVRAPAGGQVTFAGTVPGGGRTVTIRTGDGYAVTLLHLGGVTTRRGALVAEGDLVGTMGSSGTPEHDIPSVHLGIRIAAEPEGYLDPMRFLPQRAEAPAPVEPAPEPTAEPEPPAHPPGEATAEPAAETPAAETPEVATPATEPAVEKPATTAPEIRATTDAASVTGNAVAPETTVHAASARPWGEARPPAASGQNAIPALASRALGTDPRRRRAAAGRDVTSAEGAAQRAAAESALRRSVVEPSGAGSSAGERDAVRSATTHADAPPSGTNRATLAALAAVGLVLVAAAIAGGRGPLGRRAAAEAQAVPQRLEAVATEPLEKRQDGEEARTPLAPVDAKPAALERCREVVGPAKADVRLIPREDEIALLQSLDGMARVRRVDREGSGRNQDPADLVEHLLERRVSHVLDEVGGDGLLEGTGPEWKSRDVGDLEPQPREEPRRDLDRAWLRVDADDVCAERRQVVRHRASRRPQVEDPVARSRFHQIADRCKPKARPGRLAEVRGRHVGHERVVVLRRRAAEQAEPHLSFTRKSA